MLYVENKQIVMAKYTPLAITFRIRKRIVTYFEFHLLNGHEVQSRTANKTGHRKPG